MKKWVGMWKFLLSLTLLLSLFSATAQAYDVSGFVNYSGSKSGRVYLKLQGNGQFGTSIASVSAAAPVPFTIRGVQPGNYMLSAFMDVQGTGSRHTTDPSAVYMTEVITVTTANFALSSSVNLANPATVLQPAAPVGFAVLPGDNAALVMWGGGGSSLGEDAETYDLYWGTNPDPGPAASTGSILGIPATGENTVILTSLNQATIANGSQLYFSLFAKIAGQTPSVPSTTLLTTIGNPDTGVAINGTVNYTGVSAPAVPLLIALVNAAKDRPTKFYAGAVLTPNPGANPFSIAGVPDGTYEMHAILDLNNNGIMDTGDLSSGNSRNMVTVSGGTVTGQTTITVNDVNAEASVRTNHGIDGNYNLNIELSGMKKRPLLVTLVSGPNVVGPIDFPLDESWGGFYSWLNIGANVPQVNDTYLFDITYSDSSTESINGKVTGVLNSFATPITPTGNITYNATPAFSWSAPGTAPSGDWSYSIYLNNQSGGGSWDSNQIPSNMSSETFANLFPGQPNLSDNSTYSWSINVSDINGNSSSNWTNFSFGSTLAITTSILPQGTVSTFYSQSLFAAGGVSPYNWNILSGTLPPGLNLSGSMISGTPTATGSYTFTIQLQDASFNTTTNTLTIDVTAAATSLTFTGGVQDCTTTCTNIQGVNVTTVGLSPELTATSDVNGLFNLNVPPSASFHLILSKAGFNNTATTQMQFTSSYNASDRPYAMFSSANLSAWAITAGTGVIRSRIVDAVNPVTGYISGATVTASTATGPLLVEYVDPSGVISSIGPTGTNGMYIIRNIPAGAQVTVNASAPNYTNFQVKQFTVYADTVSQGRTTATLVAAGDTIPPTVPSGLTATPMGPNQINVAWSASTDNVGVDSYQVFRNGVFFSETFGVVSLVDYAVSPHINYSYSVIACDVANNCSTQSSPASAMTTSGVPTGPTNITGTISYNGSKTGRVYVSIQTDNGTLGTSVPWPAGTTSANYTIQGVPSNNLNNNLNAFMDIADNGTRSASSPAAVLAISSSIKNITLTDTTEVAPAAPALVEVKPGPASVFIMWQGNEDINGVVDADSYDVFWGTSALVNTGSKLNVATGMDSPLVIDGLTDGTAYYFQVVAKRGIYEAKSVIVGPITIGATSGLNTVSGTVTYTGTIPANTPLYVAVVVASNNKGMGSLYYTKIASASASQAFSVSGIPDGSYNVYTILDLNKDNLFATGDATNTNGEQAPMITLSGNAGKSGVIIPLVSKNAEVEVTTDHGKDVTGTSSWYSVNGRVSGQSKRPVTVTLTGKPASSTLTVPMDLGISKYNNNEFEFWNGGYSIPPTVGDAYTFSVTYSDGTSETVTGAVTGVSNNFPTNPSVTSSTIPQFSWSAPSPLPAGSYQYSLWINGINNNKMWEAWSIPSSQLQIVYGSGNDSSAAPLQTSTQYNWSISSRDQNGNRATVQGLNFTTPAVAATPDAVAPYIVTTAPVNGATGLSTNTQISVTFSELITGMPSIETSLKNNATGQYVAGNGLVSPDGLTYNFTPSALLAPGTTYSVQLSTVTDLAGNALPPTTLTFTTAGAVVTDTTKPVTTASPAGGTFASAQSITLTANEAATIYYTTNGIAPTTSSSVYSSPIAINSTTTLKYFARDTAGNSETVKTAIYTITIPDTTAPVTTVSLAGGIYSTAQSVTLTANEAAIIYYTTNGTTPTTASSVYSAPIAITATTTLKYFARDTAGNSETVGSVTYTFLPSGDINADGKVDISDAHKLLEIAVGRVQATAADLKKADVAPLVNGMPSPDGVIGVGDVVVLLRRIVGSVTW